ncbi:MAG: hypothetical protein HKN72_05950 [Gemmatimonadetes bacterium]|nr:hypothetical protein [Gemmatimonadota bacterium]
MLVLLGFFFLLDVVAVGAQSAPADESASDTIETHVRAATALGGFLLLDQERRLPVHYEDGEVIPYEEIQALVDPSGSKGAAWGTILGGLAGLTLGAAIGQCGGVRNGYRYYCSPRDESLRSVLPIGLMLTFGFAGGWIGWKVDRVTFDEAVGRLRRERRVGR